MPRVHRVKKARKDNPVAKKGEPYYWWKFAYSPKRFSLTYPKASQLTNSNKLSRYYEAQENVAALDASASIDGLVEELETIAESVREIGEEYQESADNITTYFEGGSPVAEECEEKAYACEATAESIDDVITSLQNVDPNADDREDVVADIVGNIDWEL